MREVLYIQAGNFANYVGTHFWNTQEAYFTYDDDTESLVFHDISFREGVASNSESTLNPRVLIFDNKSNFGTLSRNTGQVQSDYEEPVQSPWSGLVDKIEEEPIPQSSYHTRLEEEEASEQITDENKTTTGLEDIRSWSDYSRVYYAPKSIHPLSDSLISDVDDSWNAGKAMFDGYNEDTDLMEGAARHFVEECDNLQGIQVINDVAPFGSFIDKFLTAFQENFDAKLPSIVVPIFSEFEGQDFDRYNTSAIKKTLNNALCLQSLSERSTLTVPIRSPSIWGRQIDMPSWKTGSIFHSSALLSACMETCTLPIRLKKSPTGLGKLASHVGGVSGFATLSGLFPVTDLSHALTCFSTNMPHKPPIPYTSADVLRGFSPEQLAGYNDYHLHRGLNEVFVLRTCTDAYPLPSSFPVLDPPTQSLPVFTTLSSTSALISNISAYASYVDDCVKWKRGLDVLDGSIDEMRELKEDLVNLVEKMKSGSYEDEDV